MFISSPRNMKRLGVSLLSSEWYASPSLGYLGTLFYAWVKRSTVRVECLAHEEHNAILSTRARTIRKQFYLFLGSIQHTLKHLDSHSYSTFTAFTTRRGLHNSFANFTKGAMTELFIYGDVASIYFPFISLLIFQF